MAEALYVWAVDATRGYAIEPEGGERLTFGGATVLIKAATAACTVWEELPPLLDTPLHVHAHEDELFHILDGEHVFECGGDRFEVGPGDFLALPRGVPHAHRRVVPGAGRFLVVTCPGGFDGFFRMLWDADRAGTLGAETYADASLRYCITWVS
jgi:mannose-6-phosphate isomerase-like protein (cupin superfamily)